MSVSVGSEAYIKFILHAVKYSAQPIGGFLIGSDQVVTDILPIYHNYPLAPILEMAGGAADSLALKVIGFYFANETVSDEAMPLYIIKIEKSIIAKTGTCIILQIRNSLIDDMSSNCLLAYQLGKAIQCTTMEAIPTLQSRIKNLITTGKQHILYDIEDHLEQSELDFRNIELSNLLKV